MRLLCCCWACGGASLWSWYRLASCDCDSAVMDVAIGVPLAVDEGVGVLASRDMMSVSGGAEIGRAHV